jgi:hypothetical protein
MTTAQLAYREVRQPSFKFTPLGSGRHDDEMVQDGDANWAGYYAWSAGREPRPLLLAACEELGSGEGRMAIDTRIPASAGHRIRTICASFTEVNLPDAYLIHAGFSLPFCPPQRFPAMWVHIRRALVPGGIFAGQLFGIRDSWAHNPKMTFHARREVEELADGLQILRLCETDRDGPAFSGPKHWHTFDILVRKPTSKRTPSG